MDQNRCIIYIFRTSVAMLFITGFAQMPIFKRYYIADIPGFAWLAQFYTTFFLHYVFVTVFLFCSSWLAVSYLSNRSFVNIQRRTIVALYAGLVISGAILVAANFPVHFLSETGMILTRIAHLFFVLLFLVLSAGILIYTKGIKRRNHS